MSGARYPPRAVIPRELADVVGELPYWFVIGGQAVRCFSPYRPSHDVNFGVARPKDLDDLLRQLSKSGEVELLERAKDTAHLRWNGVRVSVFLLEELAASFVEDQHLTVTGILATKLHAIVDRGARRDFFDLYVTLQEQRLGIVECLTALREVYRTDVKEPLLLRALTYFDDAEREAPLPGEGKRDFTVVKDFFLKRVGDLLVPPAVKLSIQGREVDVRPAANDASPRARASRSPSRAAPRRRGPRRRRGNAAAAASRRTRRARPRR